MRTFTRPDGWSAGEWSLPPDEAAVVDTALTAARDRVFREQQGLGDDTEVEGGARKVTLADALVRLAQAGTDALDNHLQRTGRPGDRHQLVIHRNLRDDGTLGPAQTHAGVHLPDALARYLTCDTNLTIAVRDGMRLIGFTPTERTPNRSVRRWLERRDGGCVHPLCDNRRWLHAHHLQHWEDGGPTQGWNLVCVCPAHHRELHQGDFTIEGNPEHGPLVFKNRWGRRIEPPTLGDTGPPGPAPPPGSYQPPYGEQLTEWTWN